MRVARFSLCMSVLLVALLAHAARPTPRPQEVFAPFWTSEPGWTTELQLKNNLASGSLTVTPVLRLASGKEILLDPVTIASNDSASVWVNEGLLKHAPELLYLPTSYGSVVFRFTSLNARNLYAESLLSLRSGPIEFHVNAYPPADFAEWPRAAGPGSQEGIWWLRHSGDSDVLVVSNSSDKMLAAKLWLSDASGKRWSQSLSLAPRQTQRLDVHELVGASELRGNYGGIKIEVPTYSGALHSVHFTYNEAAKTSAYLKMFERDPNATLKGRIAPGESRPWTMWAPMLALQNPDPALGLPKGTTLQPTIFVRNTTAKPLPASITLSWRGDSGKGKVKLEDLQLAPYETRQIQVAAMQKQLNIPDDAHWALVMLSSASAMPDDLIAIATSYDSTGRYGTESAFSGSLGAHFESGAWQVDANHNQIVAVTNGGSKPANALLTLHYDNGEKKYEMQQTIQPGDQMWVNFADLIHNRVPDRNGNVLPPDASAGTYDLQDISGGYGLLQGSLALDGVWGGQTQRPPDPECCGQNDTAFDPGQFDFGVLGWGDPLIIDAENSCTGGEENISGLFTDWWSGNTAVATVTKELVTSVAPGFTYANACGEVYQCVENTGTWVKECPVAPVTVISDQITGANIAQDNISITLSGPSGTSGYLRVEFTGANGGQPIQSINTGPSPLAPGNYNFSFDQSTLPLGEYQTITATWTVDGTPATASYAYHVKVLGVYTQTQYNTPAESQCTGSPEGITVWNSQCHGTDTDVVSGFDFRVTDPKTGTGSGHSISWGDVYQEFTCSQNSGDLRGFVTIKGSLGPLSNSTVAACKTDPDLYVSGAQVYIQGEGVKTVTDACAACCIDYTHLDNYTTNTACTGIQSLPSALTVRLY